MIIAGLHTSLNHRMYKFTVFIRLKKDQKGKCKANHIYY